MGAFGAADVPLLRGQGMLDRIEGDDLLEEVPSVIPVLGIGEVRDGRIAPGGYISGGSPDQRGLLTATREW